MQGFFRVPFSEKGLWRGFAMASLKVLMVSVPETQGVVMTHYGSFPPVTQPPKK